MAGDIETEGELTRGASVFDQRIQPEWRPNMEVAVDIDHEAAQQYIVDQIMMAGNLS